MPFTSITSSSGRNFLLQVADVDVSPSSYVNIGGQQVAGFTINNNPVDISSVTGNGFREWDADGGLQDLAATVSGIFDSRTTGAQALYEAARDRVLIDCRLTSGHGDTIYFTAAVENFERNGSHEDVEKFSCSLKSHGRLQYVGV